MTTKIEFIFDNPDDPAAFEAGFSDGYLDLVRNLPGVARIESWKVHPKEDGSATPAYRTIDVWFDDYEAASAATASDAAGALFPRTVELATGGLSILFSESNGT